MIDYNLESDQITDNGEPIIINPFIQDRAFKSAEDYFHVILKVKSLRILYGLQDPKNNKPLISGSNTISNYRPNIGKGWSNGKTPEYTGLGYQDNYYDLVIRNDQLIISQRIYGDHDLVSHGPENIVFSVPKDIKGKTKRVNFLKAVAYTLITDPENIDQYLPKISYDRFSVPVIAQEMITA